MSRETGGMTIGQPKPDAPEVDIDTFAEVVAHPPPVGAGDCLRDDVISAGGVGGAVVGADRCAVDGGCAVHDPERVRSAGGDRRLLRDARHGTFANAANSCGRRTET